MMMVIARHMRLKSLVIPNKQSFVILSRTRLERRFLCTDRSKAFVIFTSQRIVTLGAVVSFLATGIYLIFMNYGNIKQVASDFALFFVANISTSTYPDFVEDSYVERSELENRITHQMTKTPNGKYCIVYGNKSVGKSSLITKCATATSKDDKKGYVRVVLSNAENPEDVLKSLFKVLNCEIMPPNVNIDIETEMRNVHEKYGLYPVIVFEVERGGAVEDKKVLGNVRSIAKRLAETCNCIIVVSESHAILEFGKDVFREDYIFVDELSIDEATTYLKKRIPEMTADDMKTQVFDTIGTNPGGLNDLVITKGEGIPVNTFVENILSKATQDLRLFPLQTILRSLKNLPDPELGVAAHHFGDQLEIGVKLSKPKEVAVIMKQDNNPLLYRMDTYRYYLLSTAHRTALQSYEPRAPPPRALRTWIEFLTGKGFIY
jgi:hypothetical protein